jgi:hypothetical protein
VKTFLYIAVCMIGFHLSFLQAKRACILVHGTWGQGGAWYQKGGDFYTELEKSAGLFVDELISFSWSGQNTVEARRAAGAQLAFEIMKYDDVIIIAHSHGGNVAHCASHYLAQQGAQFYKKIKKLYTLGTPVDRTMQPNMNVIEYVYNLFSFGDLVQPVFNFYERVYPQHDRIANISIQFQYRHMDHDEVHHPIIAHWILFIHEFFARHRQCGFELFDFEKPGKIYFYGGDTDLKYEIDEEREMLLYTDREFIKFMNSDMWRSGKNKK